MITYSFYFYLRMIYKILSLAFILGSVEADLSGDHDTNEFEHPPGYCYVKPENIPKGCARFYISDPIVEKSGTKYWQVRISFTLTNNLSMYLYDELVYGVNTS